MHFLEANDVLWSKSPFEVIKFRFPVPWSGENRFRFYIASLQRGRAHIDPTLQYVAISVVVLEEYPVSSENSEASRATRRSPSLGASGESEGLEDSDLPEGETRQSKDMGPVGRHVTALNREVKEHVSSTSFADGVSCTTRA